MDSQSHSRRGPCTTGGLAFALGLLSVIAFALTTTAQRKKQDALAPFTRTELVQFFRTVHTQASSWEETISSINPSAFDLGEQARALIEKQKGDLLYNVKDIRKLRPNSLETNEAVVLAGEFWLFNDLCEFKEGASALSNTLADDPKGQIKAARLVELYKEGATAKSTLFREIMNRTTTLGLSLENRPKAR